MSPVSAQVTRQALTATLGAVAGVGLGFGGLMWVRGAQEGTRDDAGTRAAFAAFVANGPENGTWKIETQDSVQKRRYQNDPTLPGTMLVTDLDDTLQRVKGQVPTDRIVRRLAGDSNLFLRGYGPAGPPVLENVGDRHEIGMRYTRTGCAACSWRMIYRDLVGGYVTRVEDHAYDGTLVQKVSLVKKDEPSGAATPAPARTASNTPSITWAKWVAMSPVPIYEPTRLPDGFVRVAFGVLPLDKKDGSVHLRPAVVSYSDGVARIEILIATKDDMKVVDEVAREYQKSGPSTCPATALDVPEVAVDGPHIMRRTDRCRTVLRNENFPSVVVMLIGFNEIPAHLYVETIQSLVLVK